MFAPFEDLTADPHIRGFLHTPAQPNGDALILTHGAGGNCQAKLLVEASNAFESAGFSVLRFNLPYRLERPFGPPRPGSAERDRDGLRRAVSLTRQKQATHGKSAAGRIILGGHSYGGRQATILASEDPQIADALLLFSYPLHPPNKPAQLRTNHFPALRTPAFFVHGTKDPFATSEELSSALQLIPAPHHVHEVEAAGHDLLVKKSLGNLLPRVALEFQIFLQKTLQ